MSVLRIVYNIANPLGTFFSASGEAPPAIRSGKASHGSQNSSASATPLNSPRNIPVLSPVNHSLTALDKSNKAISSTAVHAEKAFFDLVERVENGDLSLQQRQDVAYSSSYQTVGDAYKTLNKKHLLFLTKKASLVFDRQMNQIMNAYVSTVNAGVTKTNNPAETLRDLLHAQNKEIEKIQAQITDENEIQGLQQVLDTTGAITPMQRQLVTTSKDLNNALQMFQNKKRAMERFLQKFDGVSVKEQVSMIEALRSPEKIDLRNHFSKVARQYKQVFEASTEAIKTHLERTKLEQLKKDAPRSTVVYYGKGDKEPKILITKEEAPLFFSRGLVSPVFAKLTSFFFDSQEQPTKFTRKNNYLKNHLKISCPQKENYICVEDLFEKIKKQALSFKQRLRLLDALAQTGSALPFEYVAKGLSASNLLPTGGTTEGSDDDVTIYREQDTIVVEKHHVFTIMKDIDELSPKRVGKIKVVGKIDLEKNRVQLEDYRTQAAFK